MEMNETTTPEKPNAPAPARSGACPFCLRKHILKARGYAREVAEDATREWERDNLLENMMLAEDHAEALGEAALRADIRAARIVAESGTVDAAAISALHDRAKALVAAKEKEF